MSWLNYFDLAVLPPELTLGPADKKARARRARQRFWLTLAMYVGVLLGVLGENLLTRAAAGESLTLASFGGWHVLTAVIVACVIFPQVFPRIFGRMPVAEAGVSPSANRHILQFCVAFQNGFFWQALLLQLFAIAG